MVNLLIDFSTVKMPVELDNDETSIQYNIETQTAEILMGGQSTSCHKRTDGTQPKNEADRIMDDY